ncbi:protein of unknown function [Cupriavidus taiwanensis]|uniref:Uncharacterized protein n=1 Tax=Cupriavidus taiwanensis TaxID=164546 RepID=A0A7Z7J441_9BURK|nr:protein of unknown function [Cupriavidus taiwanensis]SOY99737.1 hypothetical protein CBM2595_A10080 [Cupriavidus taiwanensis]SOZ02780.1 hypothetical protein CBM2597_A10109 [Cupriavidus taiwanensis]SPC06147.1 hypothetical protein CBM2594_A10109 [Cupriavidus taiwanensis]SPD38178.1 protein of unknown function [Cupriavidus taiwanensis]
MDSLWLGLGFYAPQVRLASYEEACKWRRAGRDVTGRDSFLG